MGPPRREGLSIRLGLSFPLESQPWRAGFGEGVCMGIRGSGRGGSEARGHRPWRLFWAVWGRQGPSGPGALRGMWMPREGG